MKKLWAPWRKAYILNKPKKNCFICDFKTNPKRDQKNLVLKRTPHSLAVLNLYPYNNGHLMVTPKRHAKDLTLLNDAQLLDLFRLVNDMSKLLKRAMKPQGMNIGVNLGKFAGAGHPGHVHVHLVPRWVGDSNFMPIIGDTKVISESLASVYKRLKKNLR